MKHVTIVRCQRDGPRLNPYIAGIEHRSDNTTRTCSSFIDAVRREFGNGDLITAIAKTKLARGAGDLHHVYLFVDVGEFYSTDKYELVKLAASNGLGL